MAINRIKTIANVVWTFGLILIDVCTYYMAEDSISTYKLLGWFVIVFLQSAIIIEFISVFYIPKVSK